MTEILKTVKSVRDFHAGIKPKKWALVPTMGNLHAGHLSLVKLAQMHADVVIVSLFVNPTQFAPNEDFGAYPRTFQADFEKLQALGVDAVFVPEESAIYPLGKENTLSISIPQDMTDILCGIQRPSHFQGVATVVAKLFQIVHPDVAIFGEKDFQQLAIIRWLNKELFMNIKILGAPIVREESGLAMSSRNQYLSDEERQRAAFLSQTLMWCKKELLTGRKITDVLNDGKSKLLAQGIEAQYLDYRNKDNLAKSVSNESGVLLVAAQVGKTRLIDNLSVKEI